MEAKELSLTIIRTFNAPRPLVWEAWTLDRLAEYLEQH